MVGGDRRQALVEAAFARIASGGLEGLRLRHVAEDVGIDHSTLHHHVATKQELVLAVAGYVTRQFWTDAFDRPDPAEALHVHLTEVLDLMRDRPEVFVVTAELDLRARRDAGVAEALEDLEEGWRVRLVALVERGLAAGTWRGLDPVGTSELIIATLKGLRHALQVAPRVVADLEALVSREEPACMS